MGQLAACGTESGGLRRRPSWLTVCAKSRRDALLLPAAPSRTPPASPYPKPAPSPSLPRRPHLPRQCYPAAERESGGGIVESQRHRPRVSGTTALSRSRRRPGFLCIVSCTSFSPRRILAFPCGHDNSATSVVTGGPPFYNQEDEGVLLGDSAHLVCVVKTSS